MPLFSVLTSRLLLATCSALLVLTLVLLLVTNHQVRVILDQSQTERYQHQIDEILNSLQLQEEKLQATGLPDSYRAAFQANTIRNLRATYYLRHASHNEPQIFTLDGRVVMHPRLEAGQVLDDHWDLEKIRRLKNGQFLLTPPQGKKLWHIFKYFEPWGWVVDYTLPLPNKYTDATTLLRELGVAIFIVLVPISLLLSLYIRRQLSPIGALTEAAQHMGAGNLSHPLPVEVSGELGLLTRSFARMRDLVKTELDNRTRRIDRDQLQQQALAVLSRNSLNLDEDPHPFLRLVSEQLAKVLNCEQVSVWFFDAGKSSLQCEEFYLPEQGHIAPPPPLEIGEDPDWYDTLLAGQPVIGNAGAGVSPRPIPPDKGQAPPDGGTRLDIPVRVAGETRALIRLEQKDETGGWHEDEIAFANHVASQVSQVLDRLDNLSTEKEILRLRKELANIVDSMPSILIGIDSELHVRHWNREAEKRIGLSEEEALGRPVIDCLPQLKAHQIMIEYALAESRIQTRRKQSWFLKGHNVHFDLTVYPLLDKETSGAVIRIDDVSERVQMEEMMVQTEKMLSIGGLAAGMAHEINNPLAGILQSIQVIRNRLNAKFPKNAEVAARCGISMEAIGDYIEKRGLLPLFDALSRSGTRAAAVVDNMLSFSRKNESRQAPHRITALIDRTLELASNDYDLKRNYDFRKINIVRDDEEGLPLVPCSATEIQQVLLNLLKNGAQAMFEDPNCPTPSFTLRTRRDGHFVRIEICDNGPGIPENIRRRIFEPFFSTKEVGSGTGLGLSVSYFIIHEKHGGSMEVFSQTGEGTRFVVRLPTIAATGEPR